MPTWITTLWNWLTGKLSLVALAMWIFLLALLLTTLPAHYLQVLQIDALVHLYRPWISGALLLTLTLLIVIGVRSLSAWIKGKWHDKKHLREMKAHLTALPPDQQYILATYFHRKFNSQKWSIEDGAVLELQARGFIYQSSRLGNFAEGWAFNLSRKGAELLRNPEYRNLWGEEAPLPRSWWAR
ncbi:superinfection exclusion B family protein [Terriglobus tenax]|uniref:superinfection exclusion B family protein n=1 Tax=Terriglobus tenax TaxID=1111115 RepID=UPI0021E0E722|nr:superinfection exclusion B family protein [Terriglobus tenax]